MKFVITNAPLSKFNDTMLSALEKHTPKKLKYIRSNNCNFMTKKLQFYDKKTEKQLWTDQN